MRTYVVTMFSRIDSGKQFVVTQMELSQSAAREVCASATGTAKAVGCISSITVQVEEFGASEYVEMFIWDRDSGWVKRY